MDYVKHQFLDGRIYYGLDRLNQEFIDWLDYDENRMINNTTKKTPRELFKKEYPKLQKYYEKKNDILPFYKNCSLKLKKLFTYFDKRCSKRYNN